MKNKRFRERGSAVILALALLSLMLILIMSFVTNALLESRVSETKNYITQDKNIIENALNRALASLKYHLFMNCGDINRFNNFVSWEDDSNSHPKDVTADEYKNNKDTKYYVGIKDAMDTYLNENLKSKGIYLYRYPTDEGVTDWVINAGRSYKEQPRWQYLYNTDENDEPILFGRFSYAVLPDKGQININSLLNGEAAGERSGENTKEFRVGELVVDEYAATPKTLANNSIDLFNKIKDIGDDTISWTDKTSTTFDIPVFKTSNDLANFAGDVDCDDEGVNLFYQKFSFNKEPNDSDGEAVYVADGTGRVKKDRIFLGDAVASPNADATVTDYLDNKLPFLKNIGSEKANFGSFENRRKQITANLLDFLDGDDIPTSDVAPSSWSITNAPNYTGNEKTPYLSQVGYFFDMSVNNGNLLSNTREINLALRPQVELMNLYNLPKGNYGLKWVLDGAKLNFNISDATIKAKVTMTVKAKVKVKIKLGRFEREQELTLSIPNVTQDLPNFKMSDLSEYGSVQPIQNLGCEVTASNGEVAPAERVWENMEFSSGAAETAKKSYISMEHANFAQAIDYKAALNKFFTDNKTLLDEYTKKSFPQGTELSLSLGNINIPISGEVLSATIESITSITEYPQTYLGTNCQSIEEIHEVTIGNDTTISQGNLLLTNAEDDGVDYVKGAKDYSITNNESLNNKGNIDDGSGGTKVAIRGCLLRLVADPRANLHITDWITNSSASNITDFDGNFWPSDSENDIIAVDYESKYFDLENEFNAPSRYSSLAGISRGKKWETLNLYSAKGDLNRGSIGVAGTPDLHRFKINAIDSDGTTYANGDGGILNFIALNDTSLFKINVNTTSKDIWKGLLKDLKYYNGESDQYIFDAAHSLDDFVDKIVAILKEPESDDEKLLARSDVITLFTTAWNEAFGENLYDPSASMKDDGDQRKRLLGLIDGVMHLIKVEQYPEEFQILIVAQSIKDAGGDNSGNGIKLIKTCKCGETVETDDSAKAKRGQFDFAECSNCGKIFYFDDILGEEKILVTVRRDGDNFKVIKKERLLY